MIHYNLPSLYYGIHELDNILEIGKRYHPEMRRWEAKGSTIVDRQAGETVEIPLYSFVLFLGGNPTVVPYDIMSVLAMPRPLVAVPDLADIHAREEFIKDFNRMRGDRYNSRIMLEGTDNDQAFLEYNSKYDYSVISKGDQQVHSDSRLKLETGDTLFRFTYPREMEANRDGSRGDIDYMPTSRTIKLTEVPVSGTLDLSTPVHRRDWSQIWPKR